MDTSVLPPGTKEEDIQRHRTNIPCAVRERLRKLEFCTMKITRDSRLQSSLYECCERRSWQTRGWVTACNHRQGGKEDVKGELQTEAGVPTFVFSCKWWCIAVGKLNGTCKLEITFCKHKKCKWGWDCFIVEEKQRKCSAWWRLSTISPAHCFCRWKSGHDWLRSTSTDVNQRELRTRDKNDDKMIVAIRRNPTVTS